MGLVRLMAPSFTRLHAYDPEAPPGSRRARGQTVAADVCSFCFFRGAFTVSRGHGVVGLAVIYLDWSLAVLGPEARS